MINDLAATDPVAGEMISARAGVSSMVGVGLDPEGRCPNAADGRAHMLERVRPARNREDRWRCNGVPYGRRSRHSVGQGGSAATGRTADRPAWKIMLDKDGCNTRQKSIALVLVP